MCVRFFYISSLNNDIEDHRNIDRSRLYIRTRMNRASRDDQERALNCGRWRQTRPVAAAAAV